MGNKSWHNTYQTKETHQSWSQTWNRRQIQKKLVELTPSPQNSSKWAMIFLPPKSWFQELSSSRKTTFTPDSLRHHRRTSLQRSFNTRRSVSGGLGLAKRSKLRGQELKAQLIYFFGVPANAWKLIHNLACKVSRTRRWPVTIICLKQNMSFLTSRNTRHITKTKTNLAWASPTPGWQESTRGVCYGWLASFKAWKQWSNKW